MSTHKNALTERENDCARVRTRRPWMAFYPSDYLGDTAHLNTTEHGAYCLLIFAYWSRGFLPKSDAELALIARLSSREWRKIRDKIAAFFDADWTHHRIERELGIAEHKYQLRAAAGLKGGQSPRRKPGSNASPMLQHCSSKNEAGLNQLTTHTRGPSQNTEILEDSVDSYPPGYDGSVLFVGEGGHA